MNWQGALDLQYRWVQYDSNEDITGTGAWTDFNLTLDNVGPTATGIGDVAADEDASPTTIDLTKGFSDGGTASGNLSFAVVGNTNTSLVNAATNSSGGLTLTYATYQYGGAAIKVKATDLAGNSTEETFDVNVAWINFPPVITTSKGWAQAGRFREQLPTIPM